MPRGPLPSGNARRRNAPTIAGAELRPRVGAAPKCPLELGDAGRAWWVWAWDLPQASMWDAGSLYFVARRAALEDPQVRVDRKTGEVFEVSRESSTLREMRELDNRLGLNPKALLELRWSVPSVEPVAPVLASVSPLKIK